MPGPGTPEERGQLGDGQAVGVHEVGRQVAAELGRLALEVPDQACNSSAASWASCASGHAWMAAAARTNASRTCAISLAGVVPFS